MSFIGSKEYLYKVRQGEIDGAYIVDKFGVNGLVGTSLSPITTSGVYPTPPTLTTLEIISSDANDITGGIGGTKVQIWGLNNVNGSWTEGTEIVDMNGTTAVALSNSYFRVYRMRVVESGTYATASSTSHLGTLTLRETGAGATWATIVPETSFGTGTSEIGAFSIPAGKKANLIAKHVFVETTKPTTVIMFLRKNADDIVTPFTGVMQANEIQRGVTSNFEVRLEALGPDIVGPADIGFMASVSTGTASISVEFQLLITDA